MCACAGVCVCLCVCVCLLACVHRCDQTPFSLLLYIPPPLPLPPFLSLHTPFPLPLSPSSSISRRSWRRLGLLSWFCTDSILGGFGLYGGRGHYTAEIKVCVCVCDCTTNMPLPYQRALECSTNVQQSHQRVCVCVSVRTCACVRG